jgi:hypothetical protein
MKGTTMLTDDELAALERAESNARRMNLGADAAIIRRLIERGDERKHGDVTVAIAHDCGFRAGQERERADVVAWLRAGEIGGVDNNAARKIAIAIESCAHKETK